MRYRMHTASGRRRCFWWDTWWRSSCYCCCILWPTNNTKHCKVHTLNENSFSRYSSSTTFQLVNFKNNELNFVLLLYLDFYYFVIKMQIKLLEWQLSLQVLSDFAMSLVAFWVYKTQCILILCLPWFYSLRSPIPIVSRLHGIWAAQIGWPIRICANCSWWRYARKLRLMIWLSCSTLFV